MAKQVLIFLGFKAANICQLVLYLALMNRAGQEVCVGES